MENFNEKTAVVTGRGTGMGHLVNSEHLIFWHRLTRFAHARSKNLAHLPQASSN